MKTITFDPAVYALVTVSPSDAMLEAGSDAIKEAVEDSVGGYIGTHWGASSEALKAMLAAVPDQLPGVVEHSGEPIGEITCNFPQGWHMQALVSWNQIGQGTKLYTHPAPSQPSVLVEDDLVSVPRDLLGAACYVLNMYAPECDTLKKLRTITFGQAQPSAEALVAAALEAAANECLKGEYDGYVPPEDGRAASYYNEALRDCADVIRALDKQKIIEGAGK